MEELVRWVKNLVFIILFTTLLEMFLPESSMRKYVRVVMGFFIITIFISPLAVIFNQDLQTIYQVIPGKIIEDDWDNIKKQGEELGEENRGLLRDYYRERMEKRVAEFVALEYPDYRQEVNVQVDNDYQLSGIDVNLQGQDDTGVRHVEIRPVEIGEDEEIEDIPEATRSILKEAELNLKQRISQIFLLPMNRINVKIQDRRG